MNNIKDQVMALAAIVQSARLARQVAYKGDVAQEDLSNCLKGVFVLDPESVQDIVGEPQNLKASLQILSDMFSRPAGFLRNDEILQYALSMMRLERQLAEETEMLDTIRSSLESLSLANQEPQLIDDITVNELASIYRRTISKLPGRFQVSGDVKYLKSPHITLKVRAVLFAGIRYAVLWHQLGGRRSNLIFHRRQIFHTIKQLLETANTVTH